MPTTMKKIASHFFPLAALGGLLVGRTCESWHTARSTGKVLHVGSGMQGHPQDPRGRTADVGDEAVDVLILLVSIVNRCGINLEETFRVKEARNEARTWI